MDHNDGNMCIVGAGVAGIVAAVLCSKRGMKVSVFEQRWCLYHENEGSLKLCETRDSQTVPASNVALSVRSLKCLIEMGVMHRLKNEMMGMYGEAWHKSNNSEQCTPFGEAGEVLWSMSNNKLHSILLEALSSNENITVRYGHTLVSCDDDGNCTFSNSNGDHVACKFDLVVCSSSKVGDILKNTLQLDIRRTCSEHSCKVLNIPAITKYIREPTEDSHNDMLVTFVNDFAMNNPEGLHIWQHGKHMVIAMPNPDKSFTATLYAPHSAADDGLDSINPNDDASIIVYFQNHFPGLLALMPDAVQDFRACPTVQLFSQLTRPCRVGRLLLIGEATHKLLPMCQVDVNADMEDAMLLCQCIQSSRRGGGQSSPEGLLQAAEKYTAQRQHSADALVALSKQYYGDMLTDNRASVFSRLVRSFKSAVTKLLPRVFPTVRALLADPEVSTIEVAARYQRQDAWLNGIMWANVAVVGVGFIGLAAYGVRRFTKK